MLNRCHAKKESNSLEDVWLYTEHPKKHKPLGIILRHYELVINFKAYIHEHSSIDDIFQKTLDYEQNK